MYFAGLDFGSTRNLENFGSLDEASRVAEHIVERSLGSDRQNKLRPK
jgi:hypothetical protein